MILTKISEWTVQWKINFNPDPRKQAQKLVLAEKQVPSHTHH